MTLFKCFLFKSAFEHGDFSPFLKLALYKCNIIIIVIQTDIVNVPQGDYCILPVSGYCDCFLGEL